MAHNTLSCNQPSPNRSSDNSPFFFSTSISPTRANYLPVKRLQTFAPQPPSPDLLSKLLLECEEAYGERAVTSPDLPPASPDWDSHNCDSPLLSVEEDLLLDILPEELQVEFLLEELLSMAPVTRTQSTLGRTKATVKQDSPRQLAKQPTVKQKTPSPRVKKRATPTRLTVTMEHDAKRRKTKANSSRKLNPQETSPEGDSLATTVKMDSPEDTEIIEIFSDGEYEAVKGPSRSTFGGRWGQTSPKACDHPQEIQRLREELATAKAETLTAQAATDIARAETEAMRTLLRNKDEEIKLLEHRNDDRAGTLETLRASLNDVTRAKNASQALSEEHRALVSDHTLVTAELKDMQSKLQALQQKFEAAEKDHTEVVQGLTERFFSIEATQSPSESQFPPSTSLISPGSPVSSFSFASQQNIKHNSPPATPTLPTTPNTRATASASPFRSTASLEEKKDENVRRSYMKLKPRFDKHHALLMNLETCTKHMDLSSFGEFGRLIKQVRSALKED